MEIFLLISNLILWVVVMSNHPRSRGSSFGGSSSPSGSVREPSLQVRRPTSASPSAPRRADPPSGGSPRGRKQG
jgi:hypothetical protein